MKRLASVFLAAALCIGFFMQAYSDAKEKTRIVFVKDDDGDFFKAVADLMGNLLKAKGWKNGEYEYITLSMEGKEEKGDAVVAELKKIRPAVVMMNTTLIQKIAVRLKDTDIPCVAGGGLELADAQAHGRLAHPQPGRRRGVAAGLGEHAEPMHMAPQGLDLLFFHHCIVQYSEQ